MADETETKPRRFKVLADILDRIEVKAGFRDDGSPKKVVEHKKGDVVTFPGYEDHVDLGDHVDKLLAAGAIKEWSDEDEKAEDPNEGKDPEDAAKDASGEKLPNSASPPLQPQRTQQPGQPPQAPGPA